VTWSVHRHASVLASAERPGRFIAFFYATACGVSWLVWLPLVLGRDGVRVLTITPSLPVSIGLGTLGPLLACYLTHRLQTGNWRAVLLLPAEKLRLAWLFLGPALVAFCWFVVFPCLASKGSPMSWRWHPGALSAVLGAMFGLNLLAGPLFEEFGWRGFLQSRLQELFAPWFAAVCVGLMWAAWHLPLFFVSGWTSASPLVFLLIMTGLSVVMALGFNASGRLVPVAILMHSAFNASPRALGDYLQGVALRDYPSGDWLIAASFLLSGAVAVLLTRGELLAKPRHGRC
jgi:membrane protease YdiL (CAAX protease family)